MMRIIGTLSQIKLEGRLARVALGQYMEGIMKEGIRAYLDCAQRIIPVWSGASLSTLQAVADLIAENITSFVVNPVGGAPDRTALGQASGTASLTISKSTGTFIFRHEVDVDGELFYFELNEKYNMNPKLRPLKDINKPLHKPGPYHFREQCNSAFNDAVQGELRKFNLLSFLTRHVTVSQKVIG